MYPKSVKESGNVHKTDKKNVNKRHKYKYNLTGKQTWNKLLYYDLKISLNITESSYIELISN